MLYWRVSCSVAEDTPHPGFTMKRLVIIAGLGASVALACADVSVFGTPSATGGAGGSSGPSTSSRSASSGNVVSSGVGAEGGSVSAPASTGVGAPQASAGPGGQGSGGQGGGGACAHDKCFLGGPLTSGCDPCVTQICQQDQFCCNQSWDAVCISYVNNICQLTCFPLGMGPCGMQYPNNPLCSDDNAQCVLAYNAQQGSCATLCAAGGGECLGAFNDVNNLTCQINSNAPLSCTSQQFSSAVCVCSQGCGNGPACTGMLTCVNGQCI